MRGFKKTPIHSSIAGAKRTLCRRRVSWEILSHGVSSPGQTHTRHHFQVARDHTRSRASRFPSRRLWPTGSCTSCHSTNKPLGRFQAPATSNFCVAKKMCFVNWSVVSSASPGSQAFPSTPSLTQVWGSDRITATFAHQS